MADGQSSQGAHGSHSGGSYESGGDQSPRFSIREQDMFLPIANIGRIIRKALPVNGKIAKDAKETIQECVSEFISFITGEASEKCLREKRKTINGDDLLWAMATLGFQDYLDPLSAYLARYREMEGDTKQSAKDADARNDGLQQPIPSSEPSSSEGVDYGNTQQQAQHIMVPTPGMDLD